MAYHVKPIWFGCKFRSQFLLVAIFGIALTAYAYTASWFLLPIFGILLLLYLIKGKFISLRQLILCGSILLILILPILAFAINQFFGSINARFLGMTLTKLSGTQLDGQTIFNGGNIVGNLIDNLSNAINFIFVQHLKDGLIFNGLNGFSVFYSGFLLLFFMGCVVIFKKVDALSMLVKIWVVSCVPIVLFTSPLVHHWNFLFFPVMITAVYGIDFLLTAVLSKYFKSFLVFLAMLFVVFSYNYFYLNRAALQDSEYNAPIALDTILTEMEEANLSLEKIYVFTDNFPQNGNEFIYIRFFDPISPMDWQATKDYPYITSENLTEERYGNYYFIQDEELEFFDKENAGYLIHKGSSGALPIDSEETYAGFENGSY